MLDKEGMSQCSHEDENHILCQQCDLLVQLPLLSTGTKAVCPRCGTTLQIAWRQPALRVTCYAASAIVMLILANLFPFVNLRVAGLGSEIYLSHIPTVMMAENYASLAMLFLAFVQLVPAFCMVAIILLSQQVKLPMWLEILMAKVVLQMKAWCMVEIFLASVLVSFVKLVAYGDIGIGLSFIPYCLFCILQVRVFQFVDRRWLWQNIAPLPPLKPEQPLHLGESGLSQGLRSCHCCSAVLPVEQARCPRCHTVGHARRKNSLQWTLALLVTSILLYIPANVLPIMVTQALGVKMSSTIMSGVILLWGEHSYPVAMVIFIASIMVPSLKMLAIAWLCWDARGGGKARGHADSERMHLVYEMVEFVGRWSMIDVFVIAVLSALVQMGQFISIYPSIGALLFAVVVILTMLSAMTFDPRLTWDCLMVNRDKEQQGDGK